MGTAVKKFIYIPIQCRLIAFRSYILLVLFFFGRSCIWLFFFLIFSVIEGAAHEHVNYPGTDILPWSSPVRSS